MFLRAVCAFSLCLALSMSAPKSRGQSADPQTVTYQATIDNVKYVYATAPPVAHLKPTNILDANSLDCFGNAIKKPGDTMALVKGDNPLTGPFYVDGAEPGDTLVVKVLDLKVDGDQGVGELGAYFGALNGTKYTAMLHPALPEKIGFIRSITRTTPQRFRRWIRASK
jgi:acetamidase/formamidase